MLHQSVLVKEVLDHLITKKGKVFVDGTLGLGGYTENLLKESAKNVKVIGFELDEDNLKSAQERLKPYGKRVIYQKANFNDLQEALNRLKIKSIDGIMLDLGLSSPQVDDSSKGFSFLREGPLDMRFDKSQDLTAAEVVMRYSEKTLVDIFRRYGEEKQAARIARAIVERRRLKPFKTTLDLADFIAGLVKTKEIGRHPATRVFQALRIEVNHELEALIAVLNQAVEVMAPGARIAVVSYHSLEDRIVKMFFKERSRNFVNLPNELKTTTLHPQLKIITKKPLTPSTEELKKNPRSRSAKLRVAEKI